MDHARKGIKSIEELRPGDHVCWIYDSDEQHKALMTPYLLAGLTQNDKVVYIPDERASNMLFEYLKAENADPSPFLNSGQLADPAGY